MKQGAAGMGRVVSSSRLLQTEADHLNVALQASLGAVYDIMDDPVRMYTSPPWQSFPQRALRQGRIYFEDQLRRLEPPRVPDYDNPFDGDGFTENISDMQNLVDAF